MQSVGSLKDFAYNEPRLEHCFLSLYYMFIVVMKFVI